MNSPLVSIVLICWNRKQDVLESLKGIHAVDYKNYEVILVDNYSSDDTVEEVERQFPQVKLIRMFKNIGIEAYNIGFQNAKGEYIVILDDDSFPAKDALRRMVRKFEKDNTLGMVAFDVRNYYKYDEVANVISDKDLDTVAESKDYIMAFNGAGAAIRRNLFEEIGFYPEEFFLYWNEQDTAFRVLDKGYKILFFSDVVSYHKFSPKNRESWRAPFYYTRNMFWLVWKNYPLSQCISLTIKFIYWCFFFCMEQKTFIYLRAMLNAFTNMDKPLSKRKCVKSEVWKNLRLPFISSFTFYK